MILRNKNIGYQNEYDLVLSNRRMDLTSPHIACMTIGPKKKIQKTPKKDMLYV